MAETYLGETLVTDLKGTPYEDYKPEDWALEYILKYGGIDGEHHKTWVLDQVARILCGTAVTVTKAAWDRGAGVKQIEYRIETGEPTAEYRAWVGDWNANKRNFVGKSRAGLELKFTVVKGKRHAVGAGGGAPSKLLALEFMVVHDKFVGDAWKSMDIGQSNMALYAYAQHKNWMLDQVARILNGTPVIVDSETITTSNKVSKKYFKWVDDSLGDTNEDGEREYDYQEGEPLPANTPRGAYEAGIAP